MFVTNVRGRLQLLRRVMKLEAENTDKQAIISTLAECIRTDPRTDKRVEQQFKELEDAILNGETMRALDLHRQLQRRCT